MFGRMATQSLLDHLVELCVEIRLARGKKEYEIAAAGGASPSSVERFEDRKGHWPSKLDELILGYAKTDEREPIDLWREAIERWASAPAGESERRQRKPPPDIDAPPRRARGPKRRSSNDGSQDDRTQDDKRRSA